ncbi:hypothetical protein Ciccas_006695 [Cichlidogyrus casuarinus]|uniref:Uncharacterized protein n=1 Tax=Cichlidogyrus casuarinus TaxID=1844966 RepID=A0ABD2Q523_9PLAT
MLHFAGESITHLNLCGNNLRYIPPEICQLRNLVWLDLSRNNLTGTSKPANKIVLSNNYGDRKEADKSYNGTATNVNIAVPGVASLPNEMKSMEQLNSLNLTDCSLKVIPHVIFEIISLKQLNLSRNQLGEIPATIGQLIRLRVLNVNHTKITTLPVELVCCKNLRFLNVFGNKITHIPSILSGLVMLKRLWIDCRNFANAELPPHSSGAITSNMEMFIKRGQMQSHHIPDVLFELPSLKYEYFNAALLAEDDITNIFPRKDKVVIRMLPGHTINRAMARNFKVQDGDIILLLDFDFFLYHFIQGLLLIILYLYCKDKEKVHVVNAYGDLQYKYPEDLYHLCCV